MPFSSFFSLFSSFFLLKSLPKLCSFCKVLELRDKVCNYKSRAREGSHFLSLLEDLKKYEQQQNRKEGKPTNNDNQPEPPRKSTPVKTKPDKPASNQNPDDKKGKSGGEGEDMGAGIKPAAKIATVNDAGEEHLFWDKAHTLPGPALQKIHSLETMSNESTITSRSSRNSPEQPAPVGRREAWTDNKRPADRTHVIPPYHTAEPSDVDDTLSDVTITELSNVDEQDLSYNEKPIHHATRKLFTGKRQDIDNDRRDIGGDHKGIGITRKLIGDERNFFGDDREDIDDSQVVGNSHKYIGGSRQVVGENRGYIDEVRREISGKKVSSFSSDDERSSSVISQTSSILSVEAMDKRRALASQTLQRAKRRQAQL